MQEAVLGQSVHPQETGDFHILAATLLNVGKIIFRRKIGKVKNKKGTPLGRETHGAMVRQDWHKDLAWCFPDPCMRDSVHFEVGGRCRGDVWYGSRPSSWIWCPSHSGIVLVSRGTVTTRGAYPPSWPKGGAIVLLVTPAAAEC